MPQTCEGFATAAQAIASTDCHAPPQFQARPTFPDGYAPADSASNFERRSADGLRDQSVRYASFGSRAAAAIVDAVVIQVVSIVVNLVFLGALLNNINSTSVFLASVGPILVGGAFTLFYCVWLESSPWQATLGKRMVGLKVVDLHQERITFGKSSLRSLSKGLSLLSLGVGYLMPLWDHRRQALHDKASGCLVIKSA